MESLLEGEGEQLIRKAIELAKTGNIHAIRLCLERLLPPRKERTIQMPAKPVQNSKDLPYNFSDVLTEVAEGRITPGEASCLTGIITAHVRTAELNNLSSRLEKLELHLDDVQRYRRERSQILAEAVREP